MGHITIPSELAGGKILFHCAHMCITLQRQLGGARNSAKGFHLYDKEVQAANIQSIKQMLMVHDMDRAIAFYVGTMGFEAGYNSPM